MWISNPVTYMSFLSYSFKIIFKLFLTYFLDLPLRKIFPFFFVLLLSFYFPISFTVLWLVGNWEFLLLTQQANCFNTNFDVQIFSETFVKLSTIVLIIKGCLHARLTGSILSSDSKSSQCYYRQFMLEFHNLKHKVSSRTDLES